MPKPDDYRDPLTSADYYDDLYCEIRDLTTDLAGEFGGDPEFAANLAGAQAEALARTIQGLVYRKIPKKDRADWLHYLFTRLLADCLADQKNLAGRVIITENLPKGPLGLPVPKHRKKRKRKGK